MRQISQVDFSLIVLWSLLCFALTAEAQSNPKQGQRTAQQQPATKTAANTKPSAKNPPAGNDSAEDRGQNPDRRPVFHAPDVPPELDAILKRWEIESSKIKTLHGKQTRSEFNLEFQVEKMTKGDFFFETPDKGRIDMLAIKVKEKVTSKNPRYKKKDGDPYALESGNSERWICTGDEIVQIDDDNRSYRKVDIPIDQRGTNIVHTPLPFLFGMKAAEAKSRFALTLLKNTEDKATISVVPLMEKDRENYYKALVELNKKTYLPTRVLMMTEGNMEYLYTFDSVEINPRRSVLSEVFGTGDPYRPNLKTYTLVIPPDDPADIRPVRGSGSGKDTKRPTVEASVPNPPKRPAQSTANGKSSGSMNK